MEIHVKKNKKCFMLLAAALACLAGLSGCHKTCTCVRYDATEHDYTADEVAEYGVNCAAMRDAVNRELGTVYYSYCEWTE